MPKYRRWTASQAPRKPRAPKMPKPPKLARPKLKDLRMIYKGLLTVSVQNRIATLAYALQWYDGALPYVIQRGGGLTPEVQKKLELAVKCRKQAMGTTVDHEKDAAFLMAVRCYEKACAVLSPPSIDKMLVEFESKKTVLAEKQAALEARYGFIVKLLQEAIGNRVKLEVADAVKLVQYNPSLTTLSYNRDAVKAMAEQFRKEGIMPVFFDQLEVLSRHAALTPDGNGGLQYSADDHLRVMEEMLRKFSEFARGANAPRRLIKSGQVLPQAARATLGPAAPRQPRIPGNRGPRVGKYQGGSAMAEMLLELSKKFEHQEQDLYAVCKAANPRGILKVLEKDGHAHGWQIVRTGTGVQFTVTDPALKASLDALQQPAVQP